MRILLLGKNGQLGWELHRTLVEIGEVWALDYPEVDLAQPDSLCLAIRETQPELIVNAAAYTAVDQAENEPDLALAINGKAPGLIAEEARKLGAAMIHFSTDYVFDGMKGSVYIETDPPKPLGVYGQSKLVGDEAVMQVDGTYWIFRPSWVYSLRRDSFVTKVLHWARQNSILRVVADQISNPTWARMVAEVVAELFRNYSSAMNDRRGLYHLAGDGYTSRFEWAQVILSLDPHPEEQVVQLMLPAVTSDFPTPAKRPLFSALSCERFTTTFGLRLPAWQDSLKLAMTLQN